MEKRLITAIALSLLFLITWSALVRKFYPIENKEVIVQNLPRQTPLLKPAPPSPSPILAVPLDDLQINFAENQAAIKEVIFKSYRDYKLILESGFLLGDEGNWTKKEILSQSATFVSEGVDKKIIKRFSLSKYKYHLDLEVRLDNLSQKPLTFNLPLVLGVINFTPAKNQMPFWDVPIALADKTLHLNGRKEVSYEKIKFLGLRDRYFCVIVQSETDNYTGFIKKISPQESEVGLISPQFMLAPGEQIRQNFRIYLGPQDLKLISRLKPEWSEVIYFGAFNLIAQALLQLLELLYNLIHNWGWAIVALSLAIFILLFPLTLKQMRSMKQMQLLQPRIEELKKAYKDNPQKLNKQTMELYREYKVNPLSGCLPLILQMPIFFALYQALMRSIALKNAQFLWVKDLSEPDRLIILPTALPLLGNEVNILPILMALGMFIQQKTSLVASSGSSAEQQKLMLILFPLMFGFIFYRMPAGLVLYWLVNSTLMLAYQLWVKRKNA